MIHKGYEYIGITCKIAPVLPETQITRDSDDIVQLIGRKNLTSVEIALFTRSLAKRINQHNIQK